MGGFNESAVEEAALAWLKALGYSVLHGPDIAAGEPAAERRDPGFCDVVLERRLREALARLNPGLPQEAVEDVFRKLTHLDAPSLIERNRAAHRFLVDNVTGEYRRAKGSIRDQRQRCEGAGRRHAPYDRARARRHGAQEHHHRLDDP
jgi:type I restriction enzyme R subunit